MKYKLEEICNQIYSGGTPSTKHKEYWDGDLPWMSSGETSQRFVYTTERFITEEGVKKSSTRFAKKESTVMASAGQGHTRGQTSFLMRDMYVNQSVLVFEPNVDIVEPLYLYYNLDGRYEELRQLSDGTSTRGSLSGRIVKGMEIELPDLKVQKKVVDILCGIDKKIETNTAINRNLSEQLATIFDEMFQQAGSEMFLSDLCELTSSKRVFAKDYKESGIPFYRGKEISLRSNGIPLTELLYISEEQYQEIKEKYGVPKKGDILLTAVGTIGNSYMVQDDAFYFKDGNIIWLKNFISPEANYYVFDYMQSRLFKHDINSIRIGSTQQALTIVSLSKLKVKIPNQEKLIQYFEKSKAYHETIIRNQKENSILTALRDSLLPKLMSGELDVSGIEIKEEIIPEIFGTIAAELEKARI